MNKEFSAYLTDTGEVGFVRRSLSSLAYVEGLPSVRLHERVMYEDGTFGYVNSFTEDLVETISFSGVPPAAGLRVARTTEQLAMYVGEELLGNLINPLGTFLRADAVSVKPEKKRRIDTDPLPIRARARVARPCITGITAVDTMVPLGKGQRALVIGDQKTGKTSFLLRTLISQIREGSIGIYVSVGKSKIVLKQIEEILRAANVFDRMVIIAAYAEDPAGIVYIAPYSGMALAEYFRDAGNDVIMVVDDLSMHAKMHREIALLSRQAPGRNSYPGDMFFVHARLMERAGNFLTRYGERSITLLPVIEVAHGDITGYISTNAISMTDGHIFFDYNLYVEGRRPAVNPFLSVTRVGKQTQPAMAKEVNQLLTGFLGSAQQLETITSFGAELNEKIKETLEKQRHIFLLFNQHVGEILNLPLQLYLFAIAWSGRWKGKPDDFITHDIQTAKQRFADDESLRTIIQTSVSKNEPFESLIEFVAKKTQNHENTPSN